MKDLVNVDIFGVPAQVTREARLNEWRRIVVSYDRISKHVFVSAFPLAELTTYVGEGFLSPQTASYFLFGRVSLAHVLHLDAFSSFWQSCVDSHVLNSFKIKSKWYRKIGVGPDGSTFLFPLEELVSKDDPLESRFEFERDEYYNI